MCNHLQKHKYCNKNTNKAFKGQLKAKRTCKEASTSMVLPCSVKMSLSQKSDQTVPLIQTLLVFPTRWHQRNIRNTGL